MALKHSLVMALLVTTALTGCGKSQNSTPELSRLPSNPQISDATAPTATGSAGHGRPTSTLMGQSYSDPMLHGVPTALHITPGPIDGYVETVEEHTALVYAQQVLIASCMRDRGFQYGIGKYSQYLAAETDNRELADSRVFGLANLDQAKVYGFGDPPVAPYPVDANLSQAALAALQGPLRRGAPPGHEGCQTVAANRLTGAGNGDPVLGEQLAIYLKNEAAQEAMATEPYQAALRDWAACLNADGYEVNDPARPGLSSSWKAVIRPHAQGTPARKPERQLAVADISCQIEVNLVHRLSALVNRRAKTLLEQNATALQEQQRLINDSVQAALRLKPGVQSTEPPASSAASVTQSGR